MRNRLALLVAISVIVIAFNAIRAQSFAWCGYGVVGGLPLLETHLAGIAAITPQSGLPDQRFQFRFSLDRSEVLIEGCFEVLPEHEVIVALLDAAIPDMSAEDITPLLTWTPFALAGSHAESAAWAREYLMQNILSWGG